MKRFLSYLLILCLAGCSGPVDNSKAFAQNVKTTANMSVVIVLDGSGSMDEEMQGGTKMDVAKNALISVLSKVPAGTNLGILCFSGNTSGWIYPIQPLNNAAAADAIKQVQAGGGTPLGAYMTAATDALVQMRKDKHYGIFRVLVATDGDATDNLQGALEGPDGILSKGITIHAIGVNMSEGHYLAKKVRYSDARDPNSFMQAISAVFAETNTSTAEDDFDLIAGLDDSVAGESLKALSAVDNAPVGQHEVPPPPPQAQPAPASAPAPQAQMPTTPPSTDSSTMPWIVGAIIAVIAVVCVVAACKRCSNSDMY